ncbi:RING-H2 finger protein ATL66-like [Aristolochia californica]|uniref:RING-H2 finger protein ATL66-like n=1 Tax=Aristolochia californica TaxID=171875 RepID=UPI0035D8B527
MTSIYILVVLIFLTATCRIIGFMLNSHEHSVEARIGELPAKGLPRGLDPRVIASLPFFLYNPEEEQGKEAQCSICLSDMEKNDKVRKLPLCQHCYHAECIDGWLVKDASCPMCRAAVLQEV